MRNTASNLYEALCPASAPPERIALRCHDGRTFDHAGIEALSARLASRIAALGVTPGERVAVQVEKSAEALILYLACLRAGAVYLPLNSGYTRAELDYFLQDARPRLFVVAPQDDAALRDLADAAGATLRTLGADGASGSLLTGIADQPARFATVARQRDDLAAILYTSGTTGRPKGAMLSHGNLFSNADTLARAWRFTPDDVLLHALPIYHTHGLFVATNVSLLAGASMHLLPKFDVDEIVRALPQATVMMGVPTFYTRLLADPRLSREMTAGMRLFISGSAPLLAQTHQLWEARTGHRILERYGMTETNMNSSNPYDGERRAGTVGQPLPGVEMRIVEPESGQPLAPGAIGMIEVRGPNVFQGYWGKPDQTAQAFRPDGYFITGDLGRMDEERYVEIVGRGKDLIISGGLNIYPKEVEQLLDAVDGVVESAIIGLPHPDLGEAVTAVVVATRPPSADFEQAILAALRARLAGFKLPKHILFADDLPRNAMGKVQKNLLRETHMGLYDSSRHD